MMGTMEPVSQTEKERARWVVDGYRTDDRARCALLVVHEIGHTWALYPHGAEKLGVRLSRSSALVVAHAILTGEG
jgi:hypothetical protein